jgi:hypothetical protein
MSDSTETPTNDENLHGAEEIEAYLAEIGFPDQDAYYLRRVGRWPIGRYGKYLFATKSALDRRARQIKSAAAAAA